MSDILEQSHHCFIGSCRNYCAWIESDRKIKSEGYLLYLQKLLLDLYVQALYLEKNDEISHKNFSSELDPVQLNLITNRTSENIGEHQCYWTTFDPTENVFGNEAAMMGDLLDDVMDIYKDVKRKLMTYDLGTKESMQDALWGMKFDFWHHWSCHAVD